MNRNGWPLWLLALAVLVIGIVIARACQPAVLPDEPPAAPTSTLAVVIVASDSTPRLPSPVPATPTPEPTERLPMVTATRAPSTPTAMPTDTPLPAVTPAPIQRG